MKPAQKKRTVIVGIFIFLGVIMLMAGVLTLGNKRRTFSKTITLTATFDNVNGLLDGNNIWFSGLRVGIVKKMGLITNAQVEVEMKIDQQSQKYIYKDAKVKIGSDGLIGNKIIIIYGGTRSATSVEDGDALQVETALSSEEMISTLQENNRNLLAITSDFKLISRKLANGQGTIGELLSNDTLMNQIRTTVNTLQGASMNIRMLSSNLSGYQNCKLKVYWQMI
jgi:phospholipid/cholesterol/gamma-HCH transport system substrate-binding protein